MVIGSILYFLKINKIVDKSYGDVKYKKYIEGDEHTMCNDGIQS